MKITQNFIPFDRKRLTFLNVGDIAFLNNDDAAWTILGSCVCICLHSKRKKISAICHAQLPVRKENSLPCFEHCTVSCNRGRRCENANKYINLAIPFMLDYLKRKGIKNNELVAFITGGASIIPSNKIETVGVLNVKTTREILYNLGIQIVFENIGGTTCRKVLFDNDTGFIKVE